jgi:hypothetical protein
MYKLVKSEREHLEDLVELVKKHPNNYQLGDEIRKYILNLRYDKGKYRKDTKEN